jgi:hypothetical protein
MPRKLLLAGVFAALALAAPDFLAAADAYAGDREARMGLPRAEDGTIDVASVLRNIRARIAAGAREILFRGDMAPQEARRLLLHGRLIEQIAERLPDDGIDREVRLRGIIDARVQRSSEGELRARIEGVHLGAMGPAQRHDLARRIALQSGVDYVRIQGLDSSGDRVRADYRIERPMRPERVERAHIDRVERPERIERPDRPERPERFERPERPEKPDRGGHGRR